MTQVKEQLRLSMIKDSENSSKKPRFGLFSQPLTTAVGDDGQYKKKIHPRDPNTHKPLTQARNFYTSPTKNGQGKSQYFGELNSLATSQRKDEYIEEGKRLLRQQKQKRDKGKKHDTSFFTGAGQKLLSNSAYEYVEQKNPEKNPKTYRDSDGKVRSLPPNITSNPQSKVTNSYFKFTKHMPEPYGRAKELEVERNKKSKKLEGEQAFKPNSFAPQKLNSDKKVYEEDLEIKKKNPIPTKLNIYPHDNNWKSSSPMKQGIYGSISPFPEYIQNPPKQRKRRDLKEKEKDAFKSMSNSYTVTTPTPSVTLNRSNIMRSMGKYM